MTKKEKDGENSRRDFLKLATVAAPAAVATVTGKTADAEEIDQQSGSGMRDTAHTRAYFDSARF
jgi:hypothetical protein